MLVLKREHHTFSMNCCWRSLLDYAWALGLSKIVIWFGVQYRVLIMETVLISLKPLWILISLQIFSDGFHPKLQLLIMLKPVTDVSHGSCIISVSSERTALCVVL